MEAGRGREEEDAHLLPVNPREGWREGVEDAGALLAGGVRCAPWEALLGAPFPDVIQLQALGQRGRLHLVHLPRGALAGGGVGRRTPRQEISQNGDVDLAALGPLAI
jgi:hypothetical protein